MSAPAPGPGAPAPAPPVAPRLARRTVLSGLGAAAGAAVTGAAITGMGAGTAAAAGPKDRKGKKLKITKLATGLLFPKGRSRCRTATCSSSRSTAHADPGHPGREGHRRRRRRRRPNGAALGPDGRSTSPTAAASPLRGRRVRVRGGIPDDYTTGSIQAVDLSTAQWRRSTPRRTAAAPRPQRPGLRRPRRHHFTDYGKSDGVTGDKGRLYYAKADGSSITMIAGGMEGPNGIGLSPDGKRVYVSETYTARVWWWDVTAPGVIEGGSPSAAPAAATSSTPPADYTNFDSLGVDAHGNVCVASMIHAGISVVSRGPAGGLRGDRRRRRPGDHQHLLGRRRHADRVRDRVQAPGSC